MRVTCCVTPIQRYTSSHLVLSTLFLGGRGLILQPSGFQESDHASRFTLHASRLHRCGKHGINLVPWSKQLAVAAPRTKFPLPAANMYKRSGGCCWPEFWMTN